jgi:hypothetical protein
MMVDRSMEAGNVITVIGDGACDSIGFISREERDRTYYKAKEECQDDKILRIQNLEQNGGIW